MQGILKVTRGSPQDNEYYYEKHVKTLMQCANLREGQQFNLGGTLKMGQCRNIFIILLLFQPQLLQDEGNWGNQMKIV